MPLWKQALAFCFGLASLFLGFNLFAVFGGMGALLGMGFYYLVVAFLLLRGNREAFLDLASVVILNTPMTCVFFVAGGTELLLSLLVTVASSYGGAVLASFTAAPAQPGR